MSGIRRGDVIDVELPTGARPAVVVTRNEAIPVLARVAIVGITSTVRGHRAEVPLGPTEGLDHDCVANCDDIFTVSKQRFLRVRGSLGPEEVERLDDALRTALGLD